MNIREQVSQTGEMSLVEFPAGDAGFWELWARHQQTFFQKRRSLASLHLMNAAGSMTIPYIDEKLAMQIYNYLLYHTEVSERKWM